MYCLVASEKRIVKRDMTIAGKPTPVYVVTDTQVASGQFTIAPGKAIAVSALNASVRGVSGGNAVPVYVVDAAEAQRRGLADGLEGIPVTDMTTYRPDYGLQQAIPVYVVYGTLAGISPTPPTPPTPCTNDFVFNVVCNSMYLGAI